VLGADDEHDEPADRVRDPLPQLSLFTLYWGETTPELENPLRGGLPFPPAVDLSTREEARESERRVSRTEG
jgi:hypothetical protein